MKEEITLRDYFAAKALQSLLSNSSSYSHDNFLIIRAYEIADEMIKQRES